MTARLLNESADGNGRPSSLGVTAPAADATARPVLSVSPQVAERQAARNGPPTAPAPAPVERRGFLSPRVLDQASFDELASSLRALIDEANEASTKLAQRTDEVRRIEAGSSSASMQLQERLRLGARMLKAFQGQIARVETAVAEFDSREERLGAVQQRLDAALAAMEAKASEALARVRGQLEQETAGAAERMQAELDPLRQQVEAANDRLHEMNTRGRDLERHVEAAEVSLAALSGRMTDAATDVQRQLESVSEATRQCDEARTRLESDLGRAAEGIESACARGAHLAHEIAEAADTARDLRDELSGRLERVAKARSDLDELTATCGRLETVLDRLDPWKELLAQPTRGGLPEPVTRLVETLQHGISRDLGRLAETMRSVAARVEELSGEGAERPASKPRRPTQSLRIPDIVTVVEGSGLPTSSSHGAAST